MEDGTDVTAEDILQKKERYHGMRCHDPMEPEYQNDNRIGYIHTRGDTPYIYSHAHGGQRYTLKPIKPEIDLLVGSPNIAVDQIIAEMLKTYKFYSNGHDLLMVCKNGLVSIKAEQLSVEIHKILTIRKFNLKAGDYVPTNIPADITRSVHAIAVNGGLNNISGVLNHPTLRLDGSILNEPGYDSSTSLFLNLDKAIDYTIPESPSKTVVKKAVKGLLKAFGKFPFNSSADRGVFLSTLLTAVIRKSLPTAPATAYEASTAGSGKTLLARSAAVLAGDDHASVRPPCTTEEEWQKTLLSGARTNNNCLIIDNISSSMKGDSLNAYLTSPTYEGRILGASDIAQVSTNMVIALTGNNLNIVGDLNRRILRCRIDPQTETPERRKFKIDPHQYCVTHKHDLIAYALTIIRGYLTHCNKKSTTSTGSFTDWDRLIRQTVLWVKTLNIVDIDDPNKSFAENATSDSEKQKLRLLLNTWHRKLGSKYYTISEILNLSHSMQTPEVLAVRGVLVEIIGNNNAFNTKIVAWLLKKSAGRVIDKLKLQKGRQRRGVDTWRVVGV